MTTSKSTSPSTTNSNEELTLKDLRLCTAIVMASSVKDLFSSALLVGGDVTPAGFYYDFVFEQSFDEQMLPLIDQQMRTFIKSEPTIKSLHMMQGNAKDFLNHRGQALRAQQVSSSETNIVDLLQINEFIDLCPAKHITSAVEVTHFKLFAVEKVHIHFPESDDSSDDLPSDLTVTRITGTAFFNPMDLKKYVKKMESGKKRDHCRLGKDLDLFSQPEETGEGSWLWHPKGMAIRDQLMRWLQDEHRAKHFQFVSSPPLVKPTLYNKAVYQLFPSKVVATLPSLTIEGIEHVLMNSTGPAHALLFSKKQPNYQQLPIRYFECSEQFNGLKVNQLLGLLQTRTSYKDEAHLFCLPSQVSSELISSLQFINKMIRMFGFEHQWYLCPGNSKVKGAQSIGIRANQWMEEALKAAEIAFEVDQEAVTPFGPRIEARLTDAYGREWVGPCLEIDFNLPERFNLRYQGPDDKLLEPIMITRSIYGSIERFVAILVELHAGYFPLWLAPEQIRVIPVKEQNIEYAETVRKQCEAQGFRVSVDYRRETMGGKIHTAECDRVPYFVIVGDKEEKNDEITVRRCQRQESGTTVCLEPFFVQLHKEVSCKAFAK